MGAVVEVDGLDLICWENNPGCSYLVVEGYHHWQTSRVQGFRGTNSLTFDFTNNRDTWAMIPIFKLHHYPTSSTQDHNQPPAFAFPIPPLLDATIHIHVPTQAYLQFEEDASGEAPSEVPGTGRHRA